MSTDPQISPEIEHTLSRLSAYRNVRGVMVLLSSRGAAQSSTSPVASNGMTPSGGTSIIQSTGSVFEGESGRKYAKVLEGIVSAVANGVGQVDEGDELRFMRIRTKRHELIVTPDDRYVLVVLQDPGQE